MLDRARGRGRTGFMFAAVLTLLLSEDLFACKTLLLLRLPILNEKHLQQHSHFLHLLQISLLQ